jgi:hypothetical protein
VSESGSPADTTTNPPAAAHFMDELTPRQRDVFGLIAIGQDVGHHPRTLEALASRGLIEERREAVGRDRFGAVEITRWEVPLPVHIAWAEWCAAQPDADTP